MTEKKTNEPSFSEVYLRDFIRNNPHAEVSVEANYLIIDLPWARNDSRLKAEITDQEFIAEINKISLNPKYDALFHLADNKAEFIYSYLDPNSDTHKDTANREFTVHFEGKPYKCYFSEPTITLNKLHWHLKDYLRIVMCNQFLN